MGCSHLVVPGEQSRVFPLCHVFFQIPDARRWRLTQLTDTRLELLQRGGEGSSMADMTVSIKDTLY